jgi:hypothetical protein
MAAGTGGLGGTGPWTLTEVADAVGLSYDTVCRDVRRGVLPARRRPHAGGGARYLVTAEDLARAGRAAYRAACALAPPAPSLSGRGGL